MSEPPPQNIPMPETEEGRRLRALVRQVFGVPAGPVFIHADYEQLELRMRAKRQKNACPR